MKNIVTWILVLGLLAGTVRAAGLDRQVRQAVNGHWAWTNNASFPLTLASVLAATASSRSNTYALSIVNGAYTNLLASVSTNAFVSATWQSEAGELSLLVGDQVLIDTTTNTFITLNLRVGE